MQRAPRIPELACRDRFIKRVTAAGSLFVGRGARGPVKVPSPVEHGRDVVLLWSSRADADRWTDVLEPGAQVETITLGKLGAEIAPAAAAAHATLGLDWNVEPTETEIPPADLLARLRRESLEHFLQAARQTRTIWVLEDADGPAVMAAPDNVARVLLPCWTEREAAERCIVGDWCEAAALEIPIDSFVTLTLPWLAEQGWYVAPCPWDGGPWGPSSAPQELITRLGAALAAA